MAQVVPTAMATATPKPVINRPIAIQPTPDTPAAKSGLATREAATPAAVTGRRPNRAERTPLSSRPGTRPRT
ncbi:hypothetical protein NLM24_25680 [Nocardia zapadnayensis]|nr:hypothetical protein [Nocardia zapadnayensis]